MRSRVCFAAGLLVLGLAPPAAAHHSHAMYEVDLSVALEGIVTEFQWINPHSWLYISITNEAGESEVWALETRTPWELAEQGLGPDSLKPGDQVAVTLKPLRRGIRGGQLTSVTTSDGREYSVE